MYQRLKQRLLAWWSWVVTRWAGWVLAGAALSVALSAWITLHGIAVPWGSGHWGPLEFASNRNDLISPKLDWNRRFIRWQEGFPGTWDFIIVVDAGPAGPDRPKQAQAAEKLINELGPALRADPWVTRVVWGFDSAAVSPKAVRLETLDESQPTDDFRGWLQEMRDARDLLMSPTPSAFLGRVLGQLRAQDHSDATPQQARAGLQQLAGVLHGFAAAVRSPEPADLDKLIRSKQPPDWNYLVSDNGRLYFLRVTPRHAEGELNALEPAIRAVRRVMADVSAKHPGVPLGLTGIDVVEADETAVVDADSTWTGLATGLCMLGLLWAAFHSLRTPMMILAALGTAIAWTFGFATVAVGHLQVISIVFVPLLLGLGIAYGIYLAARMEIIRRDFPDDAQGFTAAIADVFRTMGPGIITGCVTTVAAFVMTLFTDFTGVAEMGLIAAVGVGLCLAAMFTVYPALVRLVKPGHKHVRALSEHYVHFYHDRWFLVFGKHPRSTLAVAGVLTAASLLSLYWMRFDYNLLKMQATGMESVEWEHKIVEDGGESIWFGVSLVPDLDEARKLAAEYRQQPTVGLVRGVGLLMPSDEERKVQLLTQVRNEIEAAAREGGLITATSSPISGPEGHGVNPDAATQASGGGSESGGALELQLSVLNLAFASQANRADIPAELRPAIGEVGAALHDLLGALQSLPAAEKPAHLANLQAAYTTWRRHTLTQLRQATDPAPMGLNDLPAELLEPYRGTIDGQPVLSLEIFPAALDPRTGTATSALDPRFLGRFVADMRRVDPQVSGVIVQIYESGTLIQRSYTFAGVLGLIVVFVLVVFDFQNWRDALLSLLPVVVGFALTFGLMKLCGMMINPANIVVLPLMFGIGVDSGVHMIYRWRMDPQGQPPGLTQGTGKGIMIVNLATLLGFGGMMLARHRGMQSLGFVLTVGMAMTLLACLTVMPAWLALRQRRAATRINSTQGK